VTTRVVVLPTEWSIVAPPAQVAATGTLPQSASLTRDGKHVVVVEGGQAGAGLSVYDPQTLALQSHVKLDGAFGDVALDPSGDGYWVAGAGSDALLHFSGAATAADRTVALPAEFWASAVALSPDGTTLAASGDQVDQVALVDARAGTVLGTVKTGRHPNGLAFTRDGKTLYVANWGESSVTAIDVAARRERDTIDGIGLHPERLLLSRDGTKLYVAVADYDGYDNYGHYGIEVLLVSGATPRLPHSGPIRFPLTGVSPTALALSRDGRRLFVAASASNSIEVYEVGANPSLAALPRKVGAIATGWYPTAVGIDAAGTGLYVADGMGEGSRANPQFAPFGHPRSYDGYDAASLIGSVRHIPIPGDAELARGAKAELALGGPFLAAVADWQSDPRAFDDGPRSADPGRAIVSWRRSAKRTRYIKHVIYVIKENRTYDQVLGDVAGADGDPKLAYFGETITPNEHALAKRFGVFDNTYADAVVSADGHNWSMAAFANDYVEKMWPANYGGRRKVYDFEDGADAAVPASGYLWDDAARAGISFRDYGEFVTNPARKGGDSTTAMKGLVGHIDPHYPGFDTNLRDEDREAEWAREFAGYVQRGDLPALEIVRLPNDHTAGTRSGSRTPQAMVAENDLALGRLVETVSHSPYWKDTAIFAIEDDAQNGPDHVDDQRTTFYLMSAYAKGGVQHAHYSTAGVVRTIELILGLAPMSAYDAAANPLYAAFTTTPDLRPYDAIPAKVDLEARNGATAYRAADSAKMDFSHADAAPEADLNDILAHAR